MRGNTKKDIEVITRRGENRLNKVHAAMKYQIVTDLPPHDVSFYLSRSSKLMAQYYLEFGAKD